MLLLLPLLLLLLGFLIKTDHHSWHCQPSSSRGQLRLLHDIRPSFVPKRFSFSASLVRLLVSSRCSRNTNSTHAHQFFPSSISIYPIIHADIFFFPSEFVLDSGVACSTIALPSASKSTLLHSGARFILRNSQTRALQEVISSIQYPSYIDIFHTVNGFPQNKFPSCFCKRH